MRERALLVEDDHAWKELLGEMLEDLGFAVRHVASYGEAERAIAAGPYALAVLDVSLAQASHDNRDGLRVLERFRQTHPTTPAIILTGYATVEVAVQALTRLGATDFLRKEQVDRTRFRETVQRIVGSRAGGGSSDLAPAPQSPPVLPPSEAATQPRILVVEDNGAWQSIYVELLEEAGMEMVGAVSYGEARGLLHRGRFAGAVVDLKLASSTEPRANRDGLYLLRLTREARIPTLVVSALGEPEAIDRAYEEHGIFAFFDKEGFQRATFLATLREAVQSATQPALSERAAPLLPDDSPLAMLTERQLEVLALLARGKTNNEIAEEIVVSVNTVKKHVLAIFAALGVNTRAAAATMATRYGIE